MTTACRLRSAATALSILPLLAAIAFAQDPPRGPGGRMPGSMPGPGSQPTRKVLAQFDADANKMLDREERAKAKEWLATQPSNAPRGPGGGPPGGGGRGPGGAPREPAKPGPKVAIDDVTPAGDADLYAPDVLRTLFLEFDVDDWEAELGAFYRTDVEVPAKLTVDGETLRDVGVRFRGASSFFTVPAGHKRSLNLSIDYVHGKQRLRGKKTLNLLNAHADPSFLRTILTSHVTRRYLPAPKANLVRVVVNGESWGVFVNVEQFNQEFVDAHFEGGGARWKVPGSPRGGGGLEHVGDDVTRYRQIYEIASKDDAASWQALIELCRVLTTTPLDELEAALEPILDIDSVLWFLALEVVLVNNDGYWVRASDYSLFRDAKGRFHLFPHDMNETFAANAGGPGGMRGPGGPGGPGAGQGGGQGGGQGAGPGGGPGGPGGGRAGARTRGVELDPLVAIDDPRKPLRSRLLAVPALRERYLAKVRTIAEEALDWSKLAPVVAGYRELVEAEIEADTRKLSSIDAFRAQTSDAKPTADGDAGDTGGGPRRGGDTLRAFVEGRRAFLLAHPALKR